jgi:uncharacterized membrane protein
VTTGAAAAIYVVGVILVQAMIHATTEPGEIGAWDYLGWILGWPIWVFGMLAFLIVMLGIAPFAVLYRIIRPVAPSTPNQSEQ